MKKSIRYLLLTALTVFLLTLAIPAAFAADTTGNETCEHVHQDLDGICEICEQQADFPTVQSGQTSSVFIAEAHTNVIVKFVPEETGWYAVRSDTSNDTFIDPCVVLYAANKEEIGYADDDGLNFELVFEAEKGETYYIALSSYNNQAEYSYSLDKYFGIIHQPTSSEPYVALGWDAKVTYQWYTRGDDGSTYQPIAGETAATLSSPVIGQIYYCQITCDDRVLDSDWLFYDYAITHQPTAQEPYVGLNDSTGVTYQWYKITAENVTEITDKNATCTSYDWGAAAYSAGTGWSGVQDSFEESGCRDFFTLELKADDLVFVKLSGDFLRGVGLYDYDTGEGLWIDRTDEDTYMLFAESDGTYTFYTHIGSEEVTVRAWCLSVEITPLDGETGATLQTTEKQAYGCEVTFPDGNFEDSELFNLRVNTWEADSYGWYYLDETGFKLRNDWMQDSKGWCYLGADGYMLTNSWVKDSVGWCYVGSDGYCVTNSWQKDSTGWCYLDANGRMVYNQWVKDSKGWCYVGSSGYMVTNTWVQDSKGWCYIGADGYAVTNCWKQDSVGWCYLDKNGSMTKNAWVYDGGHWYWLDGNGYMATGWKVIGGYEYYFYSSGVMAANTRINGYYVNANGQYVPGK